MDPYMIYYKLIKDFEYEIIYTEKSELNELYDYSTKYYQLPNDSTAINIRAYQQLGNFTLYLLGHLDENNNLKDDINLQNLKTYLINCINDKKYCNPKIFLSFVRFILHLQNLPICKIYANHNYKINEEDNNICKKELEAIYNNCDTIDLSKEYYCNSTLELLVSSIYEIFTKGYKIKKCKSCNKFFVARKSEAFCQYISPFDDNLSCLQYSRKNSSSVKRKNNPIEWQYNKVCNLLRKRKIDMELYHFDEKSKIDKCKKELKAFQTEYVKIKKIQYEKGEISKDELLKFLLDKEVYFKNKKKEEKKNGSKRTNKK